MGNFFSRGNKTTQPHEGTELLAPSQLRPAGALRRSSSHEELFLLQEKQSAHQPTLARAAGNLAIISAAGTAAFIGGGLAQYKFASDDEENPVAAFYFGTSSLLTFMALSIKQTKWILSNLYQLWASTPYASPMHSFLYKVTNTLGLGLFMHTHLREKKHIATDTAIKLGLLSAALTLAVFGATSSATGTAEKTPGFWETLLTFIDAIIVNTSFSVEKIALFAYFIAKKLEKIPEEKTELVNYLQNELERLEEALNNRELRKLLRIENLRTALGEYDLDAILIKLGLKKAEKSHVATLSKENQRILLDKLQVYNLDSDYAEKTTEEKIDVIALAVLQAKLNEAMGFLKNPYVNAYITYGPHIINQFMHSQEGVELYTQPRLEDRNMFAFLSHGETQTALDKFYQNYLAKRGIYLGTAKVTTALLKPILITAGILSTATYLYTASSNEEFGITGVDATVPWEGKVLGAVGLNLIINTEAAKDIANRIKGLIFNMAKNGLLNTVKQYHHWTAFLRIALATGLAVGTGVASEKQAQDFGSKEMIKNRYGSIGLDSVLNNDAVKECLLFSVLVGATLLASFSVLSVLDGPVSNLFIELKNAWRNRKHPEEPIETRDFQSLILHDELSSISTALEHMEPEEAESITKILGLTNLVNDRIQQAEAKKTAGHSCSKFFSNLFHRNTAEAPEKLPTAYELA